MTLKEIQDLIKLVNRLELAEFKMRDGDFELSIRTKKFEKSKAAPVWTAPEAVVQPHPAQSPPAAPAVENVTVAPAAETESNAAGEESSGMVPIKSPIVGTFYRSAAPDKPPYIKVGDVIEPGSVVCIVEAMKLFNEIESEVGGKVVKVLIEDASPVQYDQELFLVDPNG